MLLAPSYLLPTTASAHIVKSENTIGAILHVDPGDDPIAGSQSTLFFEFKDTKNNFDLTRCECKILISKEDQTIFEEMIHPAAESEKLSSVVALTFPEKGIYVATIKGKSISSTYFPEFTLNFNIRVAKESLFPKNSQTSWIKDNLIYLGGAITMVIFFTVALLLKKRNK